jgi:GNAT superfamily N-acetyltransferase
VHWADLNPVRGREQAGLRPVLVIGQGRILDVVSAMALMSSWLPMLPIAFSSDNAVALVQRLVRPIGWLIRPQWFVKNVAVVPTAGGEPSAPPEVSVRLGSRNDAAALAPLIHGRESLAWRFARDDIVLVAELDGHVVGCTWLTSQPMRPSYFPIKVRPGPGEWYDYGLAVLPRVQGRGLGRALSRMAMTEAGRRGGKLVFGHANRFNRIAAASHAAAGFVTVEELLGLNVLNRFVVIFYRRRRGGPPRGGRTAAEA